MPYEWNIVFPGHGDHSWHYKEQNNMRLLLILVNPE